MKNTLRRFATVALLGAGIAQQVKPSTTLAVNPLRDKDNPIVPRASALVLPRYGRTHADMHPSSSYYNTSLSLTNPRGNRWGGCTYYHEHYGVPRFQQ